MIKAASVNAITGFPSTLAAPIGWPAAIRRQSTILDNSRCAWSPRGLIWIV
ncbi:MAG: hypothetical protein ABSH34_04535 [Verrucomicrobiota bacterium]|jgi:hypothetical protein